MKSLLNILKPKKERGFAKCINCGQVFKTERGYAKHIREHEKEYETY